MPAIRSEKERQEAHPVFAAYMDMRYSRNMARDEAREKVIPTYMGLIKQIDDQMGVLMQFLEARGLLDTTMIVFTSDHGDYLGDHWMGEKDLFHDQSAKIPLIVIDPSREADATRGTVCDALVEAIDLAPTFIEYFGGKPPDHILEGRSLMPLLHGAAPADWRKVVFSEYDYCMQDVRLKLNQPIEQCRLFMVFDGRWKYIQASGFRPMLYDLESDPQEFADRGEDPACADVIARLQAALFDWALHPKMHITTPNAKIAAYAENQLAGQRRRPDRHLGRGGARRDPRADCRAIAMGPSPMHVLTALLLVLATLLPASAQIAPTEAELRAYGGLHAAAARGDVAEIEKRIASGENKEAIDGRQRTPLHVAAYQKKHDAARALIRLGADPNKLEIDRYDIITIAAVANDRADAQDRDRGRRQSEGGHQPL